MPFSGTPNFVFSYCLLYAGGLQVYNYIRFNADAPCPVEVRSPGGTAVGRGYCGGQTLDVARREAQAWMSMSAYQSERDTYARYGRNYYYIYEANTGEFHTLEPAVPPRPFTPDELARSKRMMSIKIAREAGKLYLTVDASGLHETLDAIGCTTTTAGAVTRYNDRPYTTTAVLDAGNHTLSTDLLLTKGTQRVDLSTLYTRPPTADQLKRLANSANEKARLILEHYQPIDIQVSIQKKVLAG